MIMYDMSLYETKKNDLSYLISNSNVQTCTNMFHFNKYTKFKYTKVRS